MEKNLHEFTLYEQFINTLLVYKKKFVKMTGGKITKSLDRSKADTMSYLLVLNDDYSNRFTEDTSVDRLDVRRCSPFNFLTMSRNNGTKLFHSVVAKYMDIGDVCLESAYDKIWDICSRCNINTHQSTLPLPRSVMQKNALHITRANR